nr:MAG TPA: hypothetical protein [Caudoviricetes sp.]
MSYNIGAPAPCCRKLRISCRGYNYAAGGGESP